MTIYELLQQKVDIKEYIEQYTELSRLPDGSYRGKCPIHMGDNPMSLMVTPRNGTFSCHSCSRGGSVINFVQYLDNIGYDEAVDKLAEYANIDIKRDETYVQQRESYHKNEKTAKHYKSLVSGCEEYLVKRRGFTTDVIDAFDLGWNANEESIVIPIRDHQGRVVAFARRFLNRNPKYLNSKNSDIYDKSTMLFNMDKARRLIKDRLYLVEGYMDAISGHMAGEPTVAYCTSELSKEQITLIKDIIHNNPNITIYLGADNDQIGEEKIIKMREKFSQLAPKLNVRALLYPGLPWNHPEVLEYEERGEQHPLYYKDFNDLVTKGISIRDDLQSEQIDVHALDLKLKICKDNQEKWLVAEQYCKTVTNPMVKAEIAIMLSVILNRDLPDIKSWLEVSINTDDDVLNDFKGVDECLRDYKKMIESDGLTFGYAEIDASIRGARKSDVVIFGAYSSVGKTFYAIEFAKHMAVRLKQNVLIFSLEMPAGAFMERLIANIMKVSTEQLEKMVSESEKWANIYDSVKSKLEEKIKIVDKNNLGILDIDRMIKVANARMLWKEGKTDVVIIDYFQYMKNTHNYETASNTARGLKAVAKENNVLLICLSQLSRSGSPWEKPTMQMLKMTGDLEASADIILMAWRPGLNPELTVLEKKRQKELICVTIAKARRGVSAEDFEHIFNGKETRIKELSGKEEPDV